MAENAFRPKPLVDANLVTEFGPFHEAEGSHDVDQVQGRDYTYVPGFSGMRYQRDLDLARLHRGEIRGKDVSVLPVNLRWFRTVKGSGSDPDQMRVAHAKNSGYRPVTKEDVDAKPDWITEMPAGAMVAADGTIKTAAGDNALFICSQAVAARNAHRKKVDTEAQVDGMDMRVDGNGAGLGVQGNRIKGAEPYITREASK